MIHNMLSKTIMYILTPIEMELAFVCCCEALKCEPFFKIKMQWLSFAIQGLDM